MSEVEMVNHPPHFAGGWPNGKARVDVITPANVTRVDVIDQNGVHEFWGDRWEITVHDEGRTLKIRQKDGDGAAHKAIRDVQLAKELHKVQFRGPECG